LNLDIRRISIHHETREERWRLLSPIALPAAAAAAWTIGKPGRLVSLVVVDGNHLMSPLRTARVCSWTGFFYRKIHVVFDSFADDAPAEENADAVMLTFGQEETSRPSSSLPMII
jgi:hypothetical protein